MPYGASGCGAARMLAAVALVLVVALGLVVDAVEACRGYSYVGVQDARTASGIRATLVQLDTPRVARGHVAAWVGVGGPGQGAGGRDEWIQIGLNALSDGISRLYYEIDRPGPGPSYQELASGLTVGAHYEVGVLELPSRPGWWQVWLNGSPVSDPVQLPGSTHWRPMAVAESWAGGEDACNAFAYRFENVAVAPRSHGAWSALVAGYRFLDPGYRMQRETGRSFLVSSTTSARPTVRLGVREREGGP
jgi:hypothetical protein